MPRTNSGYLLARKDKYYWTPVEYFPKNRTAEMLKSIHTTKQDNMQILWPLKVMIGSAGYGHIRPLDPEEKKVLGKEK